jgi:hypothetical protein
VIQHIKDPKMAEIPAPSNPPFYFGTKQATLEQRYYEVYNQENINLINAKTNPIKEIVRLKCSPTMVFSTKSTF